MKRGIRVKENQPGIFSSERYVTFEVDGKPYSLFVDEHSIKDNVLEVAVVDVNGNSSLVELPRDTINAGSRVRVPKEMLLSI